MLTFVTDMNEGEPDILDGHEHSDLVIKNLQGDILLILAASEPWTHEKLIALELGQMIGQGLSDGADAYLGDNWIGSTEV